MHGSVVQSGKDHDGAPTFSCHCDINWTGAECVCACSAFALCVVVTQPFCRLHTRRLPPGPPPFAILRTHHPLCLARPLSLMHETNADASCVVSVSCNTHCRAACNNHGTICYEDTSANNTSAGVKPVVTTLGACRCDEGYVLAT